MSERRLLIATIGTEYDEGVWESLMAAAEYCRKYHVSVTIDPIGNKCVTPYHGLAMMRNMGMLRALESGATHVLLVDTDVLWHDETALFRMLDLNALSVVPHYKRDFPHKLSEESPYEQTIVSPTTHILEWAIMSCVLFDCRIFTERGVSPTFFQDFMCISEEGYYWTYLRVHGVECLQDSRFQATMLRPPTPMGELARYGRIENATNEKETRLRYVRV